MHRIKESQDNLNFKAMFKDSDYPTMSQKIDYKNEDSTELVDLFKKRLTLLRQ